MIEVDAKVNDYKIIAHGVVLANIEQRIELSFEGLKLFIRFIQVKHVDPDEDAIAMNLLKPDELEMSIKVTPDGNGALSRQSDVSTSEDGKDTLSIMFRVSTLPNGQVSFTYNFFEHRTPVTKTIKKNSSRHGRKKKK